MKINNCCPHCGRSISESRSAITFDEIVAFCRENNIAIFAGNRVSPEGAARILGVSLGTVRNWRSMGSGPPCVRSGHGRTSYQLSALAEFFTNDHNT